MKTIFSLIFKLQVNKKKPLIYSFPVFPCLCVSTIHAVWKPSRNKKMKSKVVFIVLSFTTMNKEKQNLNKEIQISIVVVYQTFQNISSTNVIGGWHCFRETLYPTQSINE